MERENKRDQELVVLKPHIIMLTLQTPPQLELPQILR